MLLTHGNGTKTLGVSFLGFLASNDTVANQRRLLNRIRKRHQDFGFTAIGGPYSLDLAERGKWTGQVQILPSRTDGVRNAKVQISRRSRDGPRKCKTGDRELSSICSNACLRRWK
jgi:hypothetical protein